MVDKKIIIGKDCDWIQFKTMNSYSYLQLNSIILVDQEILVVSERTGVEIRYIPTELEVSIPTILMKKTSIFPERMREVIKVSNFWRPDPNSLIEKKIAMEFPPALFNPIPSMEFIDIDAEGNRYPVKINKVAITGEFNITRDEITEIYKKLYNVEVKQNLTKLCDAIFAGKRSGSKLIEAQRKSIPCIIDSYVEGFIGIFK